MIRARTASTRIVAMPVSTGVAGEPRGYLPESQWERQPMWISLIKIACWLALIAAGFYVACDRTDARMDTMSVEAEMGARR